MRWHSPVPSNFVVAASDNELTSKTGRRSLRNAMRDAAPETKHPNCPTCRVSMWLVKVDLGDIADRQHFSCKVCDGTSIRIVAVQAPRAIPSPSDHATLQAGERVSPKMTR
jgi:hypothetical protein